MPVSAKNLNITSLQGEKWLPVSTQNLNITSLQGEKWLPVSTQNLNITSLQGEKWLPVSTQNLNITSLSVNSSVVWGVLDSGKLVIRHGISSTQPLGNSWHVLSVNNVKCCHVGRNWEVWISFISSYYRTLAGTRGLRPGYPEPASPKTPPLLPLLSFYPPLPLSSSSPLHLTSFPPLLFPSPPLLLPSSPSLLLSSSPLLLLSSSSPLLHSKVTVKTFFLLKKKWCQEKGTEIQIYIYI